ncbi:MAG: hypothetical protein QNK37_19160 [Acidobacteriota bacterium]|nr:hypothetical protein [Acidobacteriota bacterium]
MKLELNVDELVLEGLELRDREFLQGAIERELNRLFFLQGPRRWMHGRESLNLDDVSLEVPQGAGVHKVGAQIARDLYSRINTPAPPVPFDRGGKS